MVVFFWWCGGVAVFLCGVFVVGWWCFCGGVFVVVFLCGVFVVVWWCFCGGVFVVVFLWWCSCDGVFVFLWWCFCVFVVVFLYVFFGQGSTFVALPRSYAKSVGNDGVKRCLV